MTISFKRYVNIISGVAAGNAVRQRDLILRLITSNKFVSPAAVLEFTSADGVGTYFGTTSQEYLRAVDYFAYISPNITVPEKISFSRWSEAGNGAAVIGNNDPKVLATLKLVNAGAFDIVLNGVTTHIVGVDLSAAVTMADIATALQTKIAAAIAGSTVVYAGDGPNRFTVQLPAASLGPIQINSVSAGAQDVAFLAGLSVPANAYNIAGVGPQTPLDALRASVDITDNFATLVFMDDLSVDEATTIAAYVDGQNVKYIYLDGVTAATAATWAAALATYGGTGLTLTDPTNYPNQYPDQFFGAILAAIDYDKRRSVTNPMFREGQNLAALVTSDAGADTYDPLRINYYGQTSTAGQKIAFYQRGKLMGLATDPSDMNVFGNEIWLKDYAGAQIMELQLSVAQIPANDEGASMILGVLQPVIDKALFNGVISVGKTLTPVQKVFIGQQTGNPDAWRAVESVGYVLSITIDPVVLPDSSVEYEANYTLIYSKDDAIRKVNGTHQLI